MSLAYGKFSPRDMLEKGKRGLERLEAAEAATDSVAIGDALMDMAVSLDSVRGWLNLYAKRVSKSAPAPFTEADVSALASKLELSSFTDIANEYKHAGSSRDAATDDVLPSGLSMNLPVLLGGEAQASFPRLKVIRKDASRHRAIDLARDAITSIEAFMNRYGMP